MRLFRLVLLALLAVGLLGTSVRAQECASDCALQRRGCMREARTAMRGCSLQCREGDADTACLRACVDGFVGAKNVCRDDLVKCLGGCSTAPAPESRPSAPTGGCRAGCASDLNGCVRDVRVSARECARGCADAADKMACVAACTEQSRSGSARCREGLRSCLGRCGSGASPVALGG